MAASLRRLLFPATPGAFRLWLALVVVFHHITRIEVGKTPVLVFFALSGYWVHRVLASRYALTRRPWLTFIVSRWWRIAPVMVLASVLAIGVMSLLGDGGLPFVAQMPLRQALSSVFALGYAQMPVRPVGPAWSLDIEMQFYLVAPLLALAVRRSSAIVALAGGYGLYLAGLAIYPDVVLTSFIPFFIVGMVAAQHRWNVSPRLAEASMAGAIVLTGVILLSPLAPQLLGDGAKHWPETNLLLALLLLPQALVSVQNSAPSGAARGLDAAWADQSYIVYMLHWPAILLYRGIHWGGPLQQALGGIGLGVAVALLAWLVRTYYDVPLNRARSRWVGARQCAAATGASVSGDAKEGDRSTVFA